MTFHRRLLPIIFMIPMATNRIRSFFARSVNRPIKGHIQSRRLNFTSSLHSPSFWLFLYVSMIWKKMDNISTFIHHFHNFYSKNLIIFTFLQTNQLFFPQFQRRTLKKIFAPRKQNKKGVQGRGG